MLISRFKLVSSLKKMRIIREFSSNKLLAVILFQLQSLTKEKSIHGV